MISSERYISLVIDSSSSRDYAPAICIYCGRDTTTYATFMSIMLSMLVKPGLLLSAASLIWVGGSPPHIAPKKSEESRFIGVEKKGSKTIVMVVSGFLKHTVCITCIAETVVILARSCPSHPFSQVTLDVLCGNASVVDVRITPTFLVGWVLIAAATLLRLTCYRYLGRFFTFELALREGHKLITTGPYSIVRHPAYTGVFLAFAGIALIQMSSGSWWNECAGLWSTVFGKAAASLWLTILGGTLTTFVLRTGAEDKVLRDEFGEQWDNWAKRTPYKLFPGIY
ncbi:Protein-S-isoprenylcysteine O-methyltransferase B [Grifola frondosa]|uniref:Protein-S-isoprenylcysteine O-methyltransferase B n=1 Tax=Grifola frondosa TaxID=5627 RepID=A0A1C7MAV7_GRIFR|nr:Protein-S-isoprenylcysteine O-methyltransferase B [Grifola frondosa]